MSKEKDIYSLLLEKFLKTGATKSINEFEKPEDVVTSNIGHKDIINQMNNIGHNINDKVDNSSGTTHQKLDEITNILQSFKDKNINEEKEKYSANYQELLNEIRDIKAENRIISNNLVNIKTENALRYDCFEKQNNDVKSRITLIVSVFGIIITVLFGVLNFMLSGINRDIDHLKRDNSIKIERNTPVEFEKQKNVN